MSYDVELAYIGEGMDGDYNPDDPNDVALLRFTVLDAETGEAVEKASYCTLLPNSLDEADRQLVVTEIKRRIDGQEQIKLKGICEKLSYLDMAAVECLRR